MLYYRATSFAERLRISLAVIHGEVKGEDGRNSPPPEDLILTPRKSRKLKFIYQISFSCCRLFYIEVVRKAKPPLYVVGDVKDRIAFMIVRRFKM